ncbi:MAG TPA: glycosyltransferase family 39 protein [Solirubrobacteraceae bacterium]|nr:glycosyltransferase family 39 protein [Solirubrobacteraceae bacterium]
MLPGARLTHLRSAAWASIAVAVAFVALTCWWLSRDRAIPVFDAGLHLGFALDVYESLGSGHLGRALTESGPYPPLTYLVGALGLLVGGVGVAPPILAQNVVFVTLLALGCYHVGRLAFGRLAGLLAVVFALGSPMVIEGFHEFMLDVPEAALVAVALWAILRRRALLARRRLDARGRCRGAGDAEQGDLRVLRGRRAAGERRARRAPRVARDGGVRGAGAGDRAAVVCERARDGARPGERGVRRIGLADSGDCAAALLERQPRVVHVERAQLATATRCSATARRNRGRAARARS